MIDFSQLYKIRMELINIINAKDIARLSLLLSGSSWQSAQPAFNHQSSSPINLNFIDHTGQTPLHRTCSQGSIDMVKLLVQYGASQCIRNNEGWFPIHLASFFGHVHIVRFLCDPVNFRPESIIDVYDESTPTSVPFKVNVCQALDPKTKPTSGTDHLNNTASDQCDEDNDDYDDSYADDGTWEDKDDGEEYYANYYQETDDANNGFPGQFNETSISNIQLSNEYSGDTSNSLELTEIELFECSVSSVSERMHLSGSVSETMYLNNINIDDFKDLHGNLFDNDLDEFLDIKNMNINDFDIEHDRFATFLSTVTN